MHNMRCAISSEREVAEEARALTSLVRTASISSLISSRKRAVIPLAGSGGGDRRAPAMRQ